MREKVRPVPGRTGSIGIFIGFAAAVLAAAAVSAYIGKYPVTLRQIGWMLFGGGEVPEMTRKLFFTLRLPRTCMAVLAGAGLGLAGNVYQTIFKNPLASPDIIGISGGANLGAAIAITAAGGSGMLGISAGAFAGGFAAVLCVMALVRLTDASRTATYVLAGIIMNAVSKAGIMVLKYFADPENELAAMDYWEMGSFGNVTQSKLLSVLPLLLFAGAGILLLRRQIGMMELSDHEARALGMRIRPIRVLVLLLSTLLVSSIVSVTGLISFAGLIAPHTARLILRRNNSRTMVLSLLVGAFVVLNADILARVLYSAELPISILTTVIGVPMLLYFLVRRGRERL